ncbi:MAG: nitroreductase family protein [Bacteriovoracaceae bacterium]|nr:nitroreductase family protein [Bacteriovoracaceae bacterium]
MELDEAILNRRSIRKFVDYYVTDEEIKAVLETVRWAPSWANTQVWEFIVVRNKQLIQKITETYSPSNPARKCSLSASALLIGCAKMATSGCKEGKESTKFNNWFMFDLGMCVQNLSLKAHEMGLGTVIVGSMDHNKVNELLAIPDGVEAVVAIPIGKPFDPDKKAPPRKELADFVYLEKFGDKVF